MDNKSTCFDLKWILKAKDINHKKLEPHQIVNHFPKSTDITTKVGLCRSMKTLVDRVAVDPNSFFPICFNLADPEDFEEFKEQFMLTKAESLVKKWFY